MILGAWIGLAVEERRVRFSTAGTFWRRALRLVIGLLILVALRYGLKAIFPDDLGFRVAPLRPDDAVGGSGLALAVRPPGAGAARIVLTIGYIPHSPSRTGPDASMRASAPRMTSRCCRCSAGASSVAVS